MSAPASCSVQSVPTAIVADRAATHTRTDGVVQNGTAERRDQIDIVKAIAMIAIVAIHNPLLVTHDSLCFNMLLSFALPAFFVIAGLFTDPKVALARVVFSKSRSLLRPYAVVVGIVAVAQAFFSPADAARTLAGAVYGTGATVPWVTLWFLPHLWIVALCAAVLARGSGRFRAGRAMLVCLALLLPFAGRECLDLIGRAAPSLIAKGLPFSVDVLPFSLAFTLVGFLLRGSVTRRWLSFPLFVGGLAVFSILITSRSASMDLNQRRYDSVVWTSVCALSGLVIVFFIARAIMRNGRLASVLAQTGRASISICIFHFPIQQQAVGWASRHAATATPWVAAAISACAIAISVLLHFAIQRVRYASQPIRSGDRISVIEDPASIKPSTAARSPAHPFR